MPIAIAVSRSCRTARIQVPILVCWRNRKNPISAARDTDLAHLVSDSLDELKALTAGG